MSGVQFLDLPTELIIKTLGELSVVDLCNCEATDNRFLSCLIRDSASLQYGMEKQLACVEDTPHSRRTNSLADRAQNLCLRQRAWLEFSCTRTRTIPVDNVASDMCELVSDIYFVVKGPAHVSGRSRVIKYVRIQSLRASEDPDPEFGHIEIGRPVVDFVAAIEEHNLMAVVTYTPHRSDTQMMSVDIVLLDFPSGKHHRLAVEPLIHVHDVEVSRAVPTTTIDVAGDHLALSIIYDDEAKELNMLHIFDWKSGISQMEPVAISHLGATFLAEDTILLPNGQGNSLDIYRISRTNRAAIIHSFHLPPLMPSYTVTSAICKGYPTCLGANSRATAASRGRYISDFEKSLMVVSFYIKEDDDDEGEQFLFVFLRNEFMHVLEDRTSTGHSSTEWFLWGPLITRWLDMYRIGSGNFYSMSYGRRFVWISDYGDDLQPIRLLDFNPDAVNLVAEIRGQTPRAVIHVVPRHEPTVTRYHAFQSPVESTLPYVETISPEDFEYHRVAMNEDNIVGFKFFDDPNNLAIQSIDVLEFGPS
ncbi:hypothetical protein C8R47DRAFT_1192156 [Mycena vitilis]|nr:hypothetical protein C8R47DRAFT_1192156 [Mycena vitilis]